MKRFIFIFCWVFAYDLHLYSQNKLLTIRDCILKARSELALARLPQLQFIPRTNTASYVHENALIGVNIQDFSSRILYSLNTLNQLLRTHHSDTLAQFPFIQWISPNEFVFNHGNKKIIFSVSASTLTVSEPDKAIQEEHMDAFEKNKKYCFVRNHQLYVFCNGSEKQITRDGSETIVYGQSVHQNEFGIHKGTFWSPKGNYLAFYRMDQSNVFKYPIIDWSTYPASHRTLIYPMNGTISHTVQLGIYSLQEEKVLYLQTIPDDHYLTNVAWTPDEKFILLAELNRDQNHMKMNIYDASTGKFIRTLFEEKDDKYVEPLNPPLFPENNASFFIWQSRRSGFNHLYMYDLSGRLLKTLTSGKYEVKEVFGFDKKIKYLYYSSNEGNPIGQNIYRVSLSSGKKELLTNGKGQHFAVFSSSMEGMIDVWTSVNTPRTTELVHLKNGKRKILHTAENPLQDYQTGKWEVFTIQSADGFDLFARIFYPTNFDSTKKYPVLVYLYNGPHSQLVTDTWMGGGEVWYQYMAQKGFIVFTLDGRGTSFRGKEFEQKIFRRLGKNEMEDQLTGVRWLKKKKFVDSLRMGVFGWSYGGFMTLSLMTRHPGVFKVAVAGGPVVDWRYYEIMYGERYMDTYETNKEGFEENSVLNHIQNLKGKLLVIHGAIDPVVVWQHSMILLKKAIEKGVHFDYYVYPHHEHNVLGKDRAHLMEKITDYFFMHL